jgi:excisionase family DNA binding protein
MPLDFEQIIEGYREQYPPTLNTAQVAEMLGTSAEVVRTRVSSGEIPAYRWGKNFRFFRDEVIDWLRQQSVQTAADATDDEVASVTDAPS